MSKKLLVEVDVFAKLLSLFFAEKAKGKEADLAKAIDATDNQTFDTAYKAWKSDSEKLLLSTRNLLKQSGASTAKIDKLLKQYHNY
jgi:hypothetical protein